MAIKRDNYYTVAGWMLTDLNLKGNELTAYAVVYGFSQISDHRFHGSVNYLAEWMGVSASTATRALKSLVEKGLLCKFDKEVNGVKFCEYAAVLPDNGTSFCYTPRQNDIGGRGQNEGGYVNLTDNTNIGLYPNNAYNDTGSDNNTPIASAISISVQTDNNTTPNNFSNLEEVHIADALSPTGERGGGRPLAPYIPYQQVMKEYNALCPSLPRCRVMTEQRKRHIKARFAEGFNLEMFREVFRNAEASTFLKGGGSKQFVANFDFLIGEKAVKVYEGAYADAATPTGEDPTKKYLMSDEEFDRLFKVPKEGDSDGNGNAGNDPEDDDGLPY